MQKKDIINIALNKETVFNVLVNGHVVGVTIELDDTQTGVVIRAGDKTYRHLIPQKE